MIVAITPDVRLNVEPGETIIERRHLIAEGKRAGEERWAFVGSYGGIDGAALALLGRHLPLIAASRGATIDLRALIGEVRAARQALLSALAGGAS